MATTPPSIKASDIEEAITAQRDDAQRLNLMRFFKTEVGQYGEGDEFLGLKVPQTRAIVRQARLQVPLAEISLLLDSKWHEVRLCGLLLLVEEMKAVLPGRKGDTSLKALRRRELAKFYLRHATRANNWDLVDLSCQYILGPYIRLARPQEFTILYTLAASKNLWEQRIAVVTTLDFIRAGIFSPSLRLAEIMLSHPHDLMHKATGWILRELGKKDNALLCSFLEQNYSRMPRTALRYAIERFPEPERQYWLKRK